MLINITPADELKSGFTCRYSLEWTMKKVVETVADQDVNWIYYIIGPFRISDIIIFFRASQIKTSLKSIFYILSAEKG